MIEQFVASATAVSTTVSRIGRLDEALPHLRELAGAGPTVCSQLSEELLRLLLPLAPSTSVEIAAHASLGISQARAGIAATGSILLELTDPTQRAASVLPVRHAVFLAAADIVPDLAALAPRLRQLQGSGSSYLSLNTGPSRTADIERVLTIGVHGPKELHIFLLEDRK